MVLYKICSDKETIQCWDIVVEGNTYYTLTWKFESDKIVKSKPTIVSGKNVGKKTETTPEQQALKEALAKREQKLKSGYAETIEEAKEKGGYFSPMLAEKYVEVREQIVYPVYVQPKLDGVRLLIDKDRPFSRTLKESPGGNILYDLLCDSKFFSDKESIVLDGEIYNHTLKKNFNKITSLARTETYECKETAEEAKKLIQYWVYDFFDKERPDLTFSVRMKMLEKMLEDNPSIVFVPAKKVENEEELEEAYAQFLSEGYEGLMVRTDTAYEQKRTEALLKYKPMETEEFELVGVIEGKGNRSGGAGKLVLKAKNGNTFEANIKGGFELYTRILKDQEKLIGSMVTARYQNLTPDKEVPRFAVALAIRDYE